MDIRKPSRGQVLLADGSTPTGINASPVSGGKPVNAASENIFKK